MNQQPITSQSELDFFIKEAQKRDSPLECFILLNFGIHSSKTIALAKNGDYYVYNESDDSEETISHDCLMDSNIGKAIKNNAFYKY